MGDGGEVGEGMSHQKLSCIHMSETAFCTAHSANLVTRIKYKINENGLYFKS